jgi:transcriptional regulator with XRE-family HTH domain
MKRGDKKQQRRLGKTEMNPDEQLKRLGQRIKNLRIERGYSSYEYFAYDHNISRAQFGRYEQGQDLRFTSLIKVINALGMTLPEFFSEGF